MLNYKYVKLVIISVFCFLGQFIFSQEVKFDNLNANKVGQDTAELRWNSFTDTLIKIEKLQIRFCESSKTSNKDVPWQYVDVDANKTYCVVKELSSGTDYIWQLGVKTSNSQEIQWSKDGKFGTKDSFGVFQFFIIIGSLGFFLFGMKIMSEGIQKLAGNKMRTILAAATSNRFKGVMTGFFTTGIIQSSSATTVMVVSFVNAGLLTLKQAIGLIMGANIGTTVTGFLVIGLGFGKFSISDYAFPMLAVAVPMLFVNRSMTKSLGEFLIGFAILFMGLDALKESMDFVADNPDFIYKNLVEPLSHYGFLSVIISVLIGTLLTIVVQSSSAAMALTLVLCGTHGLPFEFAAGIVLGENIGTTITANLAALIANIHAKRAAMAHLVFNVIGVIWMLLIFGWFIDFVTFLMTDTFFYGLIDQRDAESSQIRWSLAVFHLLFNVFNTILLIWFVNKIEFIVTKLVRVKKESDEDYHLEFIGGGILGTADISIYEAQKEVAKFGEITSRMNGFVKVLFNTTEKKDRKDMFDKIEKYEEITDRIEIELTTYLRKCAQLPMSNEASKKMGKSLAVASDLESIGDIYYQIGKLLEKKDNAKIWFAPEQRNHIHKLIDLVDEAFVEMNKNLSVETWEVDATRAYELEKAINKCRNEIRKQHLSELDTEDYNLRASIIYSTLYSSLEKIGDHISNVTETLVSY
jgi:phosphate:Na+ symporter